MFKQFVKITVLLLSLISVFSFQVNAKEFKENENYKIIAEIKDTENNVLEFFSYWCGHCYSLQNIYSYIEKNLEEKDLAKFDPIPVGAMGGSVAIEAQKGFFVAKNMGNEGEYNKLLFKKMHVDGEIPKNSKDIFNILLELGIPASQAQADMNSFVTIGHLAKIENLMKKFNIESVPELIVNGKYLIIQESVNSQEDLLDLIEYTLTLP